MTDKQGGEVGLTKCMDIMFGFYDNPKLLTKQHLEKILNYLSMT